MSETQPPVEPDPGAAAAKRTVLVKEPPPFKWKLMGYVDGLTVTLLKAVERTDAEAQLTRLEEEGYYRGLEIYEIDAKVPADPEAGKHAKERKAREKAAAQEAAKKEAAKKAAKKPAAKAKKPAPTVKTAGKKPVKKK